MMRRQGYEPCGKPLDASRRGGLAAGRHRACTGVRGGAPLAAGGGGERGRGNACRRRAEISSLIGQTGRLAGVVDDLLLLSRLDAGQLRLFLRPERLRPLVDGLVDDRSVLPESEGLAVEVAVPEALSVLGDHRHTSLILQCLLENARKYNRPGGRVRVAAERRGTVVRCLVGNTGKPVPPQVRPHIFERFHRGGAGEDIPGHGLGLNVARDLARLHGGDLSLARFAQGRVDRGFDPARRGIQARLDEYALRLTPWADDRLSVQAGQFATVAGQWVQRHLSWQNPFITAPLFYENQMPISDVRPPRETLAGYPRDGEAPPGNPVVWGPVYASGVAASGRLAPFEWAAEIKNAALMSRPGYWAWWDTGFSEPTVTARFAWRRTPRWTFGLSASRGAVGSRRHVAVQRPLADSVGDGAPNRRQPGGAGPPRFRDPVDRSLLTAALLSPVASGYEYAR